VFIQEVIYPRLPLFVLTCVFLCCGKPRMLRSLFWFRQTYYN